MAKILNLSTSQQINLLVEHSFGRNTDMSHTVLTNRDASRNHACIFWDGEHWLLQDSSTNGSFLNGRFIARGSKCCLNRGDSIQFGNISGETWQLVDVEAPKSMLVAQTVGLASIELDSIVVLPDEQNPEITLYQSPLGDWVCESKSGYSVLNNGDLVGNNDAVWRFIEAKVSEETIQAEIITPHNPHEIEIQFYVNEVDNQISLEFKMEQQAYELGQAEHNPLMLHLARQRINDKVAGLGEDEQGWIDKGRLSQLVGLSENDINVHVYQFRKQVINALPKSLILPQVIERRTAKIRFAYGNVRVFDSVSMAALDDNILC